MGKLFDTIGGVFVADATAKRIVGAGIVLSAGVGLLLWFIFRRP